ncbi:MAG: hypothetical protein Q8O56_08585 [Solirubrobacteraceae bacterium]|nr:hypothetical protein [Solirubrobacteraceae bacterium]
MPRLTSTLAPRRLLPALLGAAAIAAAAPSAASAGAIFQDIPPGSFNTALVPGGTTFFGDPNARNEVSMILGYTDSACHGIPQNVCAQVGDLARPPQAAAPCAALPPSSFAVCAPPARRTYTILLGGGQNESFGSPSVRNKATVFGLQGAGLWNGGRIWGGRGNDEIILHAAVSTRVDVVGGDNRVIADSNIGALGTNVIIGRTGADFISTVDGSRDTVRCGPGIRTHVRIDLTDQVTQPQNCRIIERAPVGQHPVIGIASRNVRVLGNRATIRLRCPGNAPRQCAGSLSLRTGATGTRTLGSATYRVRRGGTSDVRVQLNRRYRGRAQAIATELDPDRRPKTTTVQLRLR